MLLPYFGVPVPRRGSIALASVLQRCETVASWLFGCNRCWVSKCLIWFYAAGVAVLIAVMSLGMFLSLGGSTAPLPWGKASSVGVWHELCICCLGSLCPGMLGVNEWKETAGGWPVELPIAWEERMNHHVRDGSRAARGAAVMTRSRTGYTLHVVSQNWSWAKSAAGAFGRPGLARCREPCGLAPSWEQTSWSERRLCRVFVVEYSLWPPVWTESVVLSLGKQ